MFPSRPGVLQLAAVAASKVAITCSIYSMFATMRWRDEKAARTEQTVELRHPTQMSLFGQMREH